LDNITGQKKIAGHSRRGIKILKDILTFYIGNFDNAGSALHHSMSFGGGGGQGADFLKDIKKSKLTGIFSNFPINTKMRD
jgi:hypothetical protein